MSRPRINLERAGLRREKHSAARRAETKRGQSIGRIPKCKNPKRRKACESDFGLFCKTYFPEVFYLSWSRDHLKVISKIEQVVVDHDKFAIAMPRGVGKTRLCQAAVLWAVLFGRHKFVILIGAVASQGSDSIVWFKRTLSENELLYEDFPKVCYPIRLLENEPRRCLGQRYRGVKTSIRWGKDRIVLPTIPGSVASGFVIEATSLEGHIRGAWTTMPDGKVVRPTLALCDDPQTDETARSQGPSGQTTYRLQIINKDVQGLAGPNEQTAILIPCTVICAGDLADQVLDRKRYPDFRGERTKRLYAWPANKSLWDEYRELREQALRADQSLDESIEFYRARMATCGKRMDEERNCKDCPYAKDCMDCGAIVDWVDRLDDPRNLSAIQASMHAFYKFGPAGFAAEFQNDPLAGDESDVRLTAELCQMRYNGRTRSEVPIECTELTMGIDVQQSSLWFVIIAWEPNFTGYVIEYGVWPKQVRQVFTLKDIVDSRHNLQTLYPGRGVDGTIQCGLEELIAGALATDFKRAGGAGLMKIGRILVDSGKWPGAISAVKHKIGGATMLLCKGMGIRAGNKPMSLLRKKPGERHGEHWYMPNTRGTREFPYVAVDTNYWKSFVHSSMLTAPGDPGAMTLFGDNADVHALFASHITAETFEKTRGHGRGVEEWKIKPQRPDNHWFDAAVYCCCAASVQGVKSPNRREPGRVGIVRRKRVSIDELMARRERREG